MDTGDEIELLTRLKQGDPKAYLALYDKYHQLIYVWTIKLVKVPQLAEDLVQEVFLKVWSSGTG